MKVELTPQQIEDWVKTNISKYKIRSGGNQIAICNPFDGDDGFHFWISLVPSEITHKTLSNSKKTKNYWVHDFRPGHTQYDGSFINFVKQYKNISYFEAISEITGKSKSSLRQLLSRSRPNKIEIEEKAESSDDIILPDSMNFNISDNSTARSIASNYLKSRALTENEIAKHSIHYTATSIVFPYYEYGILTYWQERSILGKNFRFPDEIKTGLKKTDYLYNWDNIEHPVEEIIIVESIFNCISVGDNCLASGGAILAGKQLDKLRILSPKVIILAPDNDEAGIESIKKNYFNLRNISKLAYCLPPKDLDWNELDQKNGIHSALEYIRNNTYALNISNVVKLRTMI